MSEIDPNDGIPAARIITTPLGDASTNMEGADYRALWTGETLVPHDAETLDALWRAIRGEA